MPVTPINPELYHTPESLEAERQAFERIQDCIKEAVWPRFEPAFRRHYNYLRFNPLTTLTLTCGKLGAFAISIFSRRKDIRKLSRDIANRMPYVMPRASEEDLKSEAMSAAWHIVQYWLAVLHEQPKDADGFTQWAVADFSRPEILQQSKYWASIHSQIQMNGWPLKSDDLAYIIKQVINKLFGDRDVAVVMPDTKIRRQDAASSSSQ